MKKAFLILVILSSVCGVSFAAKTSQAQAPLKTERDKLSYSLGVMTGEAFRSHAVDVEPEWFAQGFRDAVDSRKLKLSEKQVRQRVQNFQAQSHQQALNQQAKMAAKNLAAGEKFLADNKKKPGVISTQEGLQYKVVKAGKGNTPGPKDVVTVNYEGKLIDGKVFDSSYRRGEPASFQVNQVIKGWQQALQRMRPGAQWELFIPANLAYGEQGVPGIGPNQVLIFKVELLSVKKSD